MKKINSAQVLFILTLIAEIVATIFSRYGGSDWTFAWMFLAVIAGLVMPTIYVVSSHYHSPSVAITVAAWSVLPLQIILLIGGALTAKYSRPLDDIGLILLIPLFTCFILIWVGVTLILWIRKKFTKRPEPTIQTGIKALGVLIFFWFLFSGLSFVIQMTFMEKKMLEVCNSIPVGSTYREVYEIGKSKSMKPRGNDVCLNNPASCTVWLSNSLWRCEIEFDAQGKSVNNSVKSMIPD